MKATYTYASRVAMALLGGSCFVATSARGDVCHFNQQSGASICFGWDQSPEPLLGLDYELTFTTPTEPEIELRTGDFTWRVYWQGNGDIGAIFCLNPEDFAVRIQTPGGGAGARNLGVAYLVPGSASNFSNLTATLTGNVTSGIYVQRSTGGQGGEVTLSVGGDLTLPDPLVITTSGGLSAAGVLTGNVDIDTLAAASTVQIGTLQGLLSIGTIGDGLIMSIGSVPATRGISLQNTGDASTVSITDLQGQLTLADLGSQSLLNIGTLAGTATVNQSRGPIDIDLVSGSLTIDQIIPFQAEEAELNVLDVTASGSITVGDDGGYPCQLYFGWPPHLSQYGMMGTLSLLGGVREGASVAFFAGLESPGVIDLNNGDVAGPLALYAGGDGSIINGGIVRAVAQLGIYDWIAEVDYPFEGTATLVGTAYGYAAAIQIAGGGNLNGTIHLTADNDGLINVTGDTTAGATIHIDGDSAGSILLGSEGAPNTSMAGDIVIGGQLTGPLEIDGTFSGTLCAANLSGTKPLPPNVQITMIGPGASVCTTAAACETRPGPLALEPVAYGGKGTEKPRFISFNPGNSGVPTAIRIGLTSLHHPTNPPPGTRDFSMFEGQARYVNSFTSNNDPVLTCPDSANFGTTFPCATLGCNAEYRDWGGAVLHVTGAEMLPSSELHVHAMAQGCATENWATYSSGISLKTARWGDVAGPNNGPPDWWDEFEEQYARMDKSPGRDKRHVAKWKR